MKHSFYIGTLLLISLFSSCAESDIVHVCIDEDSNSINYGILRLESSLSKAGYKTKHCKNHQNHESGIFILTNNYQPNVHSVQLYAKYSPGIKKEGYSIITEKDKVYILAIDEIGSLYGIMDVREQLEQNNDLSKILPKRINPGLSFRAIKFNLPWSPYRPGPATALHMETCRDLKYWEAFLDMMVENRFNALTLWNTHPFPYLIRATNYPKATPFSDTELNEWKTFWKSLFAMAKTRGIETYLVNWNIVVSPEFAEAYGAKIEDDRSELVIKYTRESVTQIINEYEDLSGLGVTLADWMGNWGNDRMTPKEREDWIQDTFVEGMKAADRQVKFIHRAVLAGDPKEMRRVIDYADLPDKTIVEVKFNWSHGHSTPVLSITHANDEGSIMRDFWDPAPENYFISWMIRNEDFFVLRWGDPEFIRNHLSTNHYDYVDGYFIGSEGYIPAVDYSQIDGPEKTWTYAFEKQWMFYRLWGRLLYSPDESDSILANGFATRYSDVNSIDLLKSYSLASKIPLWIASFYKGTWDFTLYSEGFLSPWQIGFDDRKSPFISLEELIEHETLDASYLNICDFCEMKYENIPLDPNQITPLELAISIENNCKELMENLQMIRSDNTNITLESELKDLETWGYLGNYFASKLRAGVAYTNYTYTDNEDERAKAVKNLEKGIHYWKQVIRLTENRYKPMPYVSMGHPDQKWPDFKEFHWKNFLPDVEADLEWVKLQP